MSSDVGGGEGHEKSVDPIKVFSERELTKEFEKIASLLKAEQDWSVRMAAMQKLEGIIVGGLLEFLGTCRNIYLLLVVKFLV